MAIKKPSAAQVAALAAYDIDPPESESACRSLLRWISNGGDRKDERIAIIKAAHSRFKGKRVRRIGESEVGDFLYLTWRGLGFRAEFRIKNQHKFTHPLDATVKWHDRTTTTSVGSLEIVE